jgi:hypothetical protein
MQILRQPWTSNIMETFESRALEHYITQNYPEIKNSYIGRDFPLSSESQRKAEGNRDIVFTGFLTNNPLRFLEFQASIAFLVGVQIGSNATSVRGSFSTEQLFLSETFRREFSLCKIGTKDLETQNLLKKFDISSQYVGCISILLGSLDMRYFPINESIETLFVDLNEQEVKLIFEQKKLRGSYKIITTKVSTITGELEKNNIVDSIIQYLNCAKLIVTSNIDIASAALSLGKKILLISDSGKLPEHLPRIIRGDLARVLQNSAISEYYYSEPTDSIIEKQKILREFIDVNLRTPTRIGINSENSAYKDQVLAEVLDQLMDKYLERDTELGFVLNSRSWKLTEPLRKLLEMKRCLLRL